MALGTAFGGSVQECSGYGGHGHGDEIANIGILSRRKFGRKVERKDNALRWTKWHA